MKKDAKIAYDQESRVLSVEVGKGKSADSDIQGNVVLDYDKNGKLVRVLFYDFSFDEFRSKRPLLERFFGKPLLSS